MFLFTPLQEMKLEGLSKVWVKAYKMRKLREL